MSKLDREGKLSPEAFEAAALARFEKLQLARERLATVAQMLRSFSEQSRVAAKSLAELADLLQVVADEEDERAEMMHLLILHKGDISAVAKELGVAHGSDKA